jgi:hypothetical protein
LLATHVRRNGGAPPTVRDDRPRESPNELTGPQPRQRREQLARRGVEHERPVRRAILQSRLAEREPNGERKSISHVELGHATSSPSRSSRAFVGLAVGRRPATDQLTQTPHGTTPVALTSSSP